MANETQEIIINYDEDITYEYFCLATLRRLILNAVVGLQVRLTEHPEPDQHRVRLTVFGSDDAFLSVVNYFSNLIGQEGITDVEPQTILTISMGS